MKTLVLGASGMIGNAMVRVLSENADLEVVGTLRNENGKAYFPERIAERLAAGIELTSEVDLLCLFRRERPEVVVNCAGLTKHVPAGNDPLTAIAMNAQLPHRLAELCAISGARLIHVSTDCVFAGTKGMYKESDAPDSQDVYGRTKILGEVAGPGLVTLRTSTIGHELHTKHGLLEWFLSQSECKGFTRAVFSGLPSVVFARVVRDVVIPNTGLNGLYHVAAEPIAKADLLDLIAEAYHADIKMQRDSEFVIDRSLDASRFAAATGYRAPSWREMIATMHEYHQKDLNRHV